MATNRTIADLLDLFREGQPAKSIGPRHFEDMIVSLHPATGIFSDLPIGAANLQTGRLWQNNGYIQIATGGGPSVPNALVTEAGAGSIRASARQRMAARATFNGAGGRSFDGTFVSGGAKPGAPTNLSAPSRTDTTVTLSFGPPTTNANVLNNGRYQTQYKRSVDSAWSDGTAVPYCTLSSGSVTDGFGNVWTIAATGGGQSRAVLVNGSYASGYNATFVMLIGSIVYHQNTSNEWWSFTPTSGGLSDATWANAGTTTQIPNVAVTGLTAGTAYNFEVYVTATTGTSVPSSVVSATTTGSPPAGTIFSDDFSAWNQANWYRNAFEEGGDAVWTNDPSLIPLVYTFSGGQMHLGLLRTPTGYNLGKPYISGITDTYSASNNFTTLFGYFEVTVAVDRFTGLLYECLCLTAPGLPWNNLSICSIWTDASNVQHVYQFVSNTNLGPIEATSSGGWDASQLHSYGLDFQASTISFYRDRVQVASWPNPGGGYNAGYPFYMKMHCNSNFYPGLVQVADPNSLPKYAHVDQINVWQTRPF